MSAREIFTAAVVAGGLVLQGCAASSATSSRESEPAIEAVAVLSPEAKIARANEMDTLSQRSPADVRNQLVVTGTASLLKGSCVGWYIEDDRYAVTVAPAFPTYQAYEGVFSSFVWTPAPLRRQNIGELEMLLGPIQYEITKSGAPGNGQTYKNARPDILTFDLEPDAPLHSTLTRVSVSHRSNGSFFVDEDGNPAMLTLVVPRSDPRSFRELCEAARALPAQPNFTS